MWSLPNITKMNNEASAKSVKARRVNCSKTLKDENGNAVECHHCGEPAIMAEPWYDVMSDDPKGVCGACDDHDYDYDWDGFFRCNDCGRLIIDHYTWERYGRETPDGERQCLACAAKEHFGNAANHIKLTAKGIASVNLQMLREVPHVLAVEQPTPKGWEFIENVEFDFSTGGVLTSYSSSSNNPETTVREIVEILQRAKAAGYTVVVIVMDAAYQFSGSYGVYGKARRIKPKDSIAA